MAISHPICHLIFFFQISLIICFKITFKRVKERLSLFPAHLWSWARVACPCLPSPSRDLVLRFYAYFILFTRLVGASLTSSAFVPMANVPYLCPPLGPSSVILP